MTEQPTRRSRREAERGAGGDWQTWTPGGRHRGEAASTWTPAWSDRALVVAVAASLATVGGTLVVLALSPATTFRWGLAVAGRGSSAVLGPMVVDRSDALPLAVLVATVLLVVATLGHRMATAGRSRGARARGGVTVVGAVLAVAAALNLVGCYAASGAGACTCDDVAMVAAMVAPQLVVLAAIPVLGFAESAARRRARAERRAQETQDRPAASS